MRVLFVNHTSRVSGAEHSLLDILEAFPDSVTPLVACPRGDLAQRVGRLGLPVVEIRGTDVSLRLHPSGAPLAAAQLIADAATVRRAAVGFAADIVHANSVRAGLLGVAVRRTGGPALAVHVRDVLPPVPIARLASWTVSRFADRVIANSRYTAMQFARITGSTPPTVIHNPIVNRRRVERISPTTARHRAHLGHGRSPLLAVAAQITPWKGQHRAIRVLHRVRQAHPTCRLLIVGDVTFDAPSTRFDNVAYRVSLHSLCEQLGVADAVDFLGHREDVDSILRAVDVVLIPSSCEPSGRTMVEAMAAGTPVVATDNGGPAEVIAHGADGILLPPNDLTRWAAAVDRLLSNQGCRRHMGEAGRAKALAEFDADTQVGALLGVYREMLIDRSRRRRAGGLRRSAFSRHRDADRPPASG